MKAKLIEYNLDNSEDEEMYDSMLDEIHEGCELCKKYGVARIIKEIDPTDYRCRFVDYIAGLPERWKCEECDTVYKDEDEANECCTD